MIKRQANDYDNENNHDNDNDNAFAAGEAAQSEV